MVNMDSIQQCVEHFHFKKVSFIQPGPTQLDLAQFFFPNSLLLLPSINSDRTCSSSFDFIIVNSEIMVSRYQRHSCRQCITVSAQSSCKFVDMIFIDAYFYLNMLEVF